MFHAGSPPPNSTHGADYQAGEYASAISAFNLALYMDKTHSMAYVYRGMAEGMLGNSAAAITDFTQAIHHDGDNFIAYRHRGDAHLREGHLRQALADYLRYVDVGLTHNARQMDEVQAKIESLKRELSFA